MAGPDMMDNGRKWKMYLYAGENCEKDSDSDAGSE